jgi:CheY-like chemotaxis protein
MLERLRDLEQQVNGATAGLAGPTVTNANRSPSARRALVVEDDDNERSLLAGYLRLCGYETSEASDGVEAMKHLKRHPVDLVVLDVCMPRMTGIETVRRIRSEPALKDTRIVIVSGEDREESLVTGDNRGATEWFTKPLTPDQLVEHLEVVEL